jgi:ATP-dependent protease ClpP protease subunit
MSDGYITFIQGFDFITGNNLVACCHKMRSDGVTDIHLGIGSGGGNLNSGFSVYTALRGLTGVKFHTYNLGAVNSVALLIYAIGEQRIAAPMSSFLFHSTSWNFNGDIPASQIADAHNTLTHQERALYGEVASATGIDPQKVSLWHAGSHNMPAQQALAEGFCTSLGIFTVPQGANHIQVGR